MTWAQDGPEFFFSYSALSLILLFSFLFFFILYISYISHTHVYLSGWCINVCSILCDLSAPIVKIPLHHFSAIPLSNSSKLLCLVQKKEQIFVSMFQCTWRISIENERYYLFEGIIHILLTDSIKFIVRTNQTYLIIR